MSRAKRITALDLWPDDEDAEVNAGSTAAVLSNEHAYLPSSIATTIAQERRIDTVPPVVHIPTATTCSEDDDNKTFATPLIAHLASDYFRNVIIIGKDPERFRHLDNANRTKAILNDAKYEQFIQKLIDKHYEPPARVSFINRRIAGHRVVCNEVLIGGETYKTGEVIITAAGDVGSEPAPVTPKIARPVTNKTVGSYFWFGVIVSIEVVHQTAHVQWLYHACTTLMEELAHPQELFLSARCGNIPLQSILGKAKCRKTDPRDRPVDLEYDEFFFSLCYDVSTASFREIMPEVHIAGKQQKLSRACSLCIQEEDQSNAQSCKLVTEENGSRSLLLNDTPLHRHDFVTFRTTDTSRQSNPCSLGQILSIDRNRSKYSSETTATIRLFDRAIGLDTRGGTFHMQAFSDRELFLTNDCVTIKLREILDKCFILPKESIRYLEFWLQASPKNFYASTKAATHASTSHVSLLPLTSSDIPMCKKCMPEKLREVKELYEFKQEFSPLRAFDPFAGVGAFVRGVENAGGIKFTHAIEICPSTAMTLRKNNPGVAVFNQCANAMFDYVISREAGMDTDLRSLEDKPPVSDDIDCIVTGFPCQPHSSLNMFKKADDKKSDLILTVLSWVDHIKPKYCLFENVPGFLGYKLNAQQHGKHALRGGVESGGIKFLVRTLTALGYQVRFAIIQAGHYGVPQSRERFFLWAALPGYPLPEFPRPTHDFPCRTSMPIKLSVGITVAPIDCRQGIYPLPFVTVKDAIGDLKRWHWKNPHKVYKRTPQDVEVEERDRQTGDIIRSHERDDWCGYEGRGIPYEHPPRTAFQARCRQRESENIQHYTPCLKEATVEQVVNIEMKPNANFLSLNSKPKLLDWQIVGSTSANARQGYRSSYYGRLDENNYFRTTVTNVHPTAKQGKILNPWCKRMLTVRELARSQGFPDNFVFHSLDKDVKNMHRQIGNAVPLPLGEALGRELFNAMFQKWRKERGRMNVDE